MKVEQILRIGARLLGSSMFVLSGLAQGQTIDNEQIQKVLGQAQEIERCMAKSDAAAMQVLRERGEQISNEIEGLCKAGKRDVAQAKALDFGREMADSPAMVGLQECAGALGALLPVALASLQGNAVDAVQVCDIREH